MSATLEHISNLAIVEAQRSAAVAAKQEQDVALRKKEEEDRRKNEELRHQAIESKIAVFLERSRDYLAKGDFNRALDEVARAYLLDPANDKIHAAEDHIRKTQEETRLRIDQERIQKQQEDNQKRQELLKAQVARMQQEKEEKRRREEEARNQAQQQKISQYLNRAQEFLNNGRLDEALSELAFVVVVDPLNEEVLSLERKIRDAQEQEQAEQLEQYHRREEEQRKKREAIITAIQKHIENAERLAESAKVVRSIASYNASVCVGSGERSSAGMREAHTNSTGRSIENCRRTTPPFGRNMCAVSRRKNFAGSSKQNANVLCLARAQKQRQNAVPTKRRFSSTLQKPAGICPMEGTKTLLVKLLLHSLSIRLMKM